jgi:hypothetical protein
MAVNEWDWGTVDTGTPTTHDDYSGFDAAYNTQEANLSRASLGGMSTSDLLKMAMAGRGRRAISDIYMENRRYNKMLTDEAFERSLGWDMEGPAGSTSFDKDTREMLAEFTPEMQDLYQGWLRAEQRAGEELAAYDIDERTTKKIDLWRSANAEQERRQRQELAAANVNQGIGGTLAYWKEKALEDSINQGVMDFTANVAHPLSLAERGLLSAEQLAFGNAAIDAPRTLMRQLELGLQAGQGSHTGVNMEGNALASMALADTKAGFWSGLMGGMSNYGGSGSPSASGSGLLKGLLNPYGSSMMTTNKGSLA